MSLRSVGEASVYTPPANRGWVKRIRLPSMDDDAVPLGGLEELDQSAVVGRGRLADQLHGRRGQAGGGE